MSPPQLFLYALLKMTQGKRTREQIASRPRKVVQQSGAILIFCLIMLLLLTLIGAAGIQSTTLEEKMASNLRDENIAFQTAETTLRVAESIVATTTPVFSALSTVNGSNGLYTTIGATPSDPAGFWKTVNWGGSLVATPTVFSSSSLYIIEQLPSTTETATGTSSGGSLEGGTPPGSISISWYRITARGTGTTANAVVMLQSIYKR